MTIKPIAGTFSITGDDAGTTVTITFQALHAKPDGSTETVTLTYFSATDARSIRDQGTDAMQRYLESVNPGVPRAVSIAAVLNGMAQSECDTRGL